MDFFNTLESLLEESDSHAKCQRFNAFYEQFRQDNLSGFDSGHEIKRFSQPSYSEICTIVPPLQVPKRKNLSTDEGKAILIHAILHIEYSAIDLALDAAYRFRGLPEGFYHDWLEVAHEEVRHFLMLQELLHSLGYTYGDFPVHTSLFEASSNTPCLLERMAIVPRYLEAQGLDSNQVIIKKLHRVGDSMSHELLKALDVILNEEIDHVSKGDRWFKHACALQKQNTDIYFDIVKSLYPNAFTGKKPLNREARIQAGFSDNELQKMEN